LDFLGFYLIGKELRSNIRQNQIMNPEFLDFLDFLMLETGFYLVNNGLYEFKQPKSATFREISSEFWIF
jgi:hypothetical protein